MSKILTFIRFLLVAGGRAEETQDQSQGGRGGRTPPSPPRPHEWKHDEKHWNLGLGI
jgi:hypothetical protein